MVVKNKRSEIRFRTIIGFFCLLIFGVGVLWTSINNRTKNVAYADLTKGDEINEGVLFIEIERSFARVRFESGVQRTVYFARNNAYTPSDLSFFLQKGDRFLKRANDDTIKVIRQEITFTFVLGKEILCCK